MANIACLVFKGGLNPALCRLPDERLFQRRAHPQAARCSALQPLTTPFPPLIIDSGLIQAIQLVSDECQSVSVVQSALKVSESDQRERLPTRLFHHFKEL